jgi:uracil phosphoribosyltransferase
MSSDKTQRDPRVVVVDHPLVQHKLTSMRQKDCPSGDFRRLLREISYLLGYEITRDLPLTKKAIETPLQIMDAPVIAGREPVLVGILRAGLGLVEGILELMPTAQVGHLGLYRDHATLEAIEYYAKLPTDLVGRDVLLLDPMLATAHTAVAAITRVKVAKPGSIKFVCLLAAPEGIETLLAAHPDVSIFTAAIDDCLNERGYIVPGLGDAGDRIFGTR